MTNTEKRSLYESIMRDVSKTVKSRITRLDESDSFAPYTRRLQTLYELGDDISSLSKQTLMSVIDRVLKYEESGSDKDVMYIKKIRQAALNLNW